MTTRAFAEIARKAAVREAAGLSRSRHCVASRQGARLRVDGRELLHFGSNDYLGLAAEARVVAAAQDGAARYGVGAGASHLISGHFAAHATLEQQLAAWVAPCADAGALLFSAGYLANLAIVTGLAGRGDAVFGDRLNHACLNDAALLSRAQFSRYRHGDLGALERQLAASRAPRKLICTDAVFSMDGDIAPLPQLLDLAERHDAWLVVDDAHGFGVLGDGRGTLAHFGLASSRIVYMGTLGKAAGVAGAFVAAHGAVIETLLQTARSYVFTTAAPPLLACAAQASLALIRGEPQRRERLRALVARFRASAATLPWRVLPSETPIQPLLVGANAAAVALSEGLWQRGVWIPAIRPPTVPQGTARLRITFSAAHSDADADAPARGARRGRRSTVSRVAIESAGTGPPLVLLHGWAMHSGLFAPLLPHLTDRFRVHRVDLPGHGRSAPCTRYALDAIVAALAAAVAQAAGTAAPLTLLGWSLGGAVALRWASAEPARVCRLILTGTTPCFIARPDWPHALPAQTLRQFGDELAVSYRLTLQRFVTLQARGSEHARALLAQLRGELFARGEPTPATLSATLELLAATDLRAELGAIAQPAVVIAGERDTLTPPEAAAWLARALPRGSFHLIRGAAHAAFLSHPAAFVAAMADAS